MSAMKFAIVLLSLVSHSQCWPSGAPDAACSTLLPNHGNNRAKPANQAPFLLAQDKSEYGPGEQVKVVLRTAPGYRFKGLIVQAYDPSSKQPIGAFEAGTGLKLIPACSAITHTDKRGKRAAVLIWTAPGGHGGGKGRVAFRATVVQRYSEFYYGIESVLDKRI